MGIVYAYNLPGTVWIIQTHGIEALLYTWDIKSLIHIPLNLKLAWLHFQNSHLYCMKQLINFSDTLDKSSVF